MHTQAEAQDSMGGYENLPNPVPFGDMVYSHVGVALLGGYNGQAGSVPTTITDGQTVSYTFNYTLPSGVNIEDMTGVGVLIDQTNGEIVNAGKVRMNGSRLGLENANKMNLTVYPNPASDVVKLAFDATAGDYEVTIHDLAGRVVLTQAFANLSGTQNIELSTGDFNAGQYLITLAAEGQSFTQILSIK